MKLLLPWFALFSLAASGAWAQFTNQSSVLDGSGTLSSGGSFTNISAAGQPGGIAVSAGGSVVNYAGFLNTFSLRPGLDSDGDGLANEVDADNDNDALGDGIEIAGSAFNPSTMTDVNAADSDLDGVPDGEESAAGTDPTDSGAFLEIAAFDQPGPSPKVTWIARQNKVYTILKDDGDYDIPSSPLGMSTGGLGAGPWQVTTNIFTDIGGGLGTGRFYSVQTVP